MRRKENLLTIQEMYDKFKDFYECDEISLKTYHKILSKFNIWVREWTFKSNIFIMPYKLGKIYVNQSKPTFEFNDVGKLTATTARIDWVATRQLWKKYPHFQPLKKYVYYENNHTDGRKMRISWEKGKVHGITLTYFRPCRTYQRDLAKHIFKNPTTQYYGW